MPPAVVPCKNKISSLLYDDENELVLKLLGPRCQSLAMTVVQLFETQPPNHSQWNKKHFGVLCFVKDNHKKNYFFRVYCMKRNKMVWEQEMYKNMDYISLYDYLHTFEGEDCMVCFNFANEDEARDMKTVVDSKIIAKRKREARKERVQTTNSSEVQITNVQNNSHLIPKYTDPAAKKAKRKRNITKADIGNPLEFRHISHVGWHPDKGFDVNSDDVALKEFFHKAGVSESQLKDRETRQFIYDFIAANGGRDAVLEQELKTKKPPPPSVPAPAPGPPVPPRGAPRSTHNRAAPPPPTSGQAPPPRPPPTTPRAIHNAPVPPPPSGSAPPAPSGNAPPPPPPPPPPPVDIPMSPPMPVTPVFSQDEPTSIDSRSALMKSIRGGATLKPVEVEKKVDNARGDLLSEIRKGFQLKPANEREVKPISPAENQNHSGDLAAALSRALAERNRFIHPDEDEDSDSSDSNDDEWDA